MESPTNNPLDVVKGREQETGPFIGIVIILALFAVGALYFWKHELVTKSERASTATTTKIVIYRRASPATTTEPAASSTGNAELDSIQNALESQTQNIDGLNF